MTTDDTNKASGDQTNAQGAQGFIGQASGPIAHNFGEQTNAPPAGYTQDDRNGIRISAGVYSRSSDTDLDSRP
jgi:hypothetical protein